MPEPIRSHLSTSLRSMCTASSGSKDQEYPVESFLWVNKDHSSTSVRRNSRDEKRSIYRHVQRNYYRRLRAEKEAFISNCQAKSLVGWASPVEYSASISSSSSPASSPVTDSSWSSDEPVESFLPSTSDGGETDGEYSEDTLMAETPPIELRSCLDGTVEDQFDCPLSLTSSQMESLLQLCDIHRQLWFADMRWSKEKRDQVLESGDHSIEEFMSDQLGMHALLAYLATIREAFGVSIGREGAESTILIHNALTTLRRHLQSNERSPSIDISLLRAVYFLCLVEAYRDNEDGYLSHFKMVKFLVDQLGGLDSLEEHLKISIIVADVYLAAERVDSPIFAASWDPGPFPLEAWGGLAVNQALSRLGTGFLLPREKIVVPWALRSIIISIVELVSVDQSRCFRPSARQRECNEWISLRQLAIIHKLAGLRVERDGPTDALRVALIFWMMLVQTQFGRYRSVALIGPRLKNVLQNCKSRHTAFFSDHPELLLWILAVGSMTCGGADGMGGAKQIVEQKWFIKELALVCKRLRIQTDRQIINHLSQYLFLDMMCSIGLEVTISRLWRPGYG